MFSRKFFIFGVIALQTIAFLGCTPEQTQTPSQTSEPKSAQVEKVELLTMESFPVQITAVIQGNLRNGCEQITDHEVQREGNTFMITLSTEEKGEMCTQALVPFEEKIPLEVLGLKAGTYEVKVNNDVSNTFTLGMDNIASQSTLPSGDFSNDNLEDIHGTVYVKGYSEVKKVNEAFCGEDENCEQYDAVYFYILEHANPSFQDFLNSNNFTGKDYVVLGCKENNIITYYNESNETGMKKYTVPETLSKKILDSHEQKPISLKLTRLKSTGGSEAPTCYSHITIVEEYVSEDKDQSNAGGRIAKGVIEGSMGYPSEIIPNDIKVCADNLETKETVCTDKRIEDKKYISGIGYTLDVAPGTYYVYETRTIVIPDSFSQGFKAYYSEFVKCGEKVGCDSHDPIKVTVKSGETVSGIDPVDWYLPER